MQRTIDVKISEQYGRVSSALAGVRGEGNVTPVRVWFDTTWDGLTKRVIWHDAKGQEVWHDTLNIHNRVQPPFDGDDTDAASGGVYRIVIPPAALKYTDKCYLLVRGDAAAGSAEGGLYGRRGLAVKLTFRVEESLSDGGPWPPGWDVSQTLYDQLMEAIDRLMGYEDRAKYWSEMSKSWAVDDTGLRPGEATNNSKYWAEMSAEYAAGGGGGGVGGMVWETTENYSSITPGDLVKIHKSSVVPTTPEITVGGLVADAGGHLGLVTEIDGDIITVKVLASGGSSIINNEVITNWLYADDGAIARLVVGRLRTDYMRPWDYLEYKLYGTTPKELNYLDIYQEQTDYITATPIEPYEEEQFCTYNTADPVPIWWVGGIEGGKMTIDENRGKPPPPPDWNPDDPWNPDPVPVMVFKYNEIIKRSDMFWHKMIGGPDGDQVEIVLPATVWGYGDPNGRTKAYVYKDELGYTIEYEHSNGDMYFLKIGEYGITSNPPISGGGTSVYVVDSIPTAGDLIHYPNNAVVFVRGEIA